MDIKIIPCWIPREENEAADALSKFRDTDDWGIDPESFQYIQQKFGHFDIDRFADPANAKLRRFDSRFHNPQCENVNTFTVDWANEFNWWCPPTFLVPDTIRHAKTCKATGVLLVPEWPTSFFWPLLTPDGKHFDNFVKDYVVLDPYFHSTCPKSIFNGFASFRTLALLISFA